MPFRSNKLSSLRGQDASIPKSEHAEASLRATASCLLGMRNRMGEYSQSVLDPSVASSPWVALSDSLGGKRCVKILFDLFEALPFRSNNRIYQRRICKESLIGLFCLARPPSPSAPEKRTLQGSCGIERRLS